MKGSTSRDRQVSGQAAGAMIDPAAAHPAGKASPGRAQGTGGSGGAAARPGSARRVKAQALDQ